MSVIDDQRIEDLERWARSLSTRIEHLEHATPPPRPAAPGPAAPGPAAGPAAPGPGAPRPWTVEPTTLPTVRLSTPPPSPDPETPARDSHQRFEDLLGGRMLAWLGGVAVVTGIVLFFAYAISHGWVDEAARAAFGGAGSLALLGLGVWLHDRRGRTDAARTVVAAAVAGLFITVVVASRVYGLIPVALGFALALVVGATAATLAVRWNAQVIAALGITGALLSPVLVGAPGDGATLAVVFATALSAVAVLLWRRWDWLGFAVLLVCAPQWLGWLTGGPSLTAALAVLVAFGALGHLAAIGFELRLPERTLRPSSSLLLALNAAVLALAGYGALAAAGRPVAAGLWLGALAAGHLALALLARRVPRVGADIALLLLTLGVLLGDVAFALLARGPVLAAGLAATGVLFARLVARTGKRPHDHAVTEVGLGGHVAGALLVAIGQATPLGLFGHGDDHVAATIALAAVAAAAFTSARLTKSSNPVWRIVLDGVGLAVTAYLTAISLSGAELVLAWAGEAAALAGIARRRGDHVAGVASMIFLAGADVHAFAIEAPLQALVLGVSDVAAAATALGGLVVACLIIARAKLTVAGRPTAGPLAAGAALALLYLASVVIVSAFQPSVVQSGDAILALGVRQQGQMLLSCLWALTGVGALILGLRRDHRILRLGALGILLITAGKVFLYDLATLDAGYRIFSFIVLGLLLLLGAFAYQRLRPPPAPDLRTVPRALR
ncbi:MAG TPA: DUF2339 domain-containing protein [Solirubrobacteraceae bacterium]|jgi:uncharacterized membrane protein|nr:DUF2339 domain-containing protein [Solirubrobacteraceae bacterium]